MTGGAGFIGSHLIPRLLAVGAEVVPMAMEGADAESLGRVLSRCDSLVHLGYRRPTTSGYWPQLGEELRLNVLDTVRLLDVASAARIEHISFASSAAVHVAPLTPYALAKLHQEDCVRRWAVLHSRPVSVLRLATVYGPGETVARAVPNFIRALLAGRPPRVDGRGSRPFDLVYVDDVARAFELAVERRADGTFDIGTGEVRTAKEVAAILIDLVGVRCDVEENLEAQERSGAVCDASAAEHALGFRAATTLEVGLRAEIDWFRRLPMAISA